MANRGLAGSVPACALGLLVVLALAAAPAGARLASLTLDPAEGPPNSSVDWLAEGFEGCAPVDDVDSVGVVVIRWDGRQVVGRAGVSADDGSAASTFLVPESAELGVHRVTATCLTDGSSGAVQFTVTPPVVVQVPVPSVIGLSEGRARAILEAEKFTVEVSGDGDQVQRQDPPGGTEVDPGTVVVIELGDARPRTVEVPSVIGLGLDAATEEIRDAGLELGGVSGVRAGLVADQSPGAGTEALLGATVSISLAPVTAPLVLVPDLVGEPYEGVPGILVAAGLALGIVSGDVDPDGANPVAGQEPPAGSEVARGSTVNISVEPAVAPSPFVVVPDLIGDDSDEARALLERLGLVADGSSDTGEVTNQQPAPGTLVALGSPVSLVLEPDAPRNGLVAVLAVAAAAAAGAAAYRPVKHSRDRNWVRQHLDVTSGARTSASSIAEAREPTSAPTRVARVVARRDPGTHEVKEHVR